MSAIWYATGEPARVDCRGRIYTAARGMLQDTGRRLERVVGDGGEPLLYRHTLGFEVDALWGDTLTGNPETAPLGTRWF